MPSPSELHVTFVCTGNICRSPMADKIFADAIAREGLSDRVRVTSAGTGSWHVGDGADPRTVAELEANGYPSEHRARTLDDDILAADLVVALDTGHRRDLLRAGVPEERLALLRSFDPDADSESVDDPYYGDAQDFETVRVQVEAAVPGLLAWVADRV
ncbi:putative low molecular weight protein-tyrosine-phosphatase [Rhodococcoides trifolii]|uniref:protein-tyrosine-phosphatase n=1 Tax=Rhodococcoides trifolii TaxID=908250 RepID=A0A917FUW2_9NOCA|nr:low molecular weight protein-tyrosine-phosphatase [Rhodococcus trifolii]GGG04830.1 putative low molecular weight protein-tyrosine-phosphatase [Rhodococcus trifolii]